MTTIQVYDGLSPQQQALLSSAAAIDEAVTPVLTHDAQGQPIAAPEEQQSAQDAAFSRNRDLLTLGVTMLAPMLPFIPQCYPPATIEQIAAAFTAVEIKRGWNLQEAMSAEVMLAIVAVPPTIQAVILGRQYIAALKAQKTPQNAANDSEPEKVINEHGE